MNPREYPKTRHPMHTKKLSDTSGSPSIKGSDAISPPTAHPKAGENSLYRVNPGYNVILSLSIRQQPHFDVFKTAYSYKLTVINLEKCLRLGT
ncbi:unnamed protein product [Dibothriocephalus latus]|uniref:Uncharacterized protein n=1 Tax=Dibothriocephalus latus TaxID=60516 RepID=A0A3P7MEC6_DIBLA|nr:unnamed protein product [Dibothriocephalus latus]